MRNNKYRAFFTITQVTTPKGLLVVQDYYPSKGSSKRWREYVIHLAGIIGGESHAFTTPSNSERISLSVGKMMQKSVGILASKIYPSVLNLVQRFDQQRRGFEHALSYLSISIIILIYREVLFFMCALSLPFSFVLFCPVWLGLLMSWILIDSWTISYRIQQPRGLNTVRNSTHLAIMSDNYP